MLDIIIGLIIYLHGQIGFLILLLAFDFVVSDERVIIFLNPVCIGNIIAFLN